MRSKAIQIETDNAASHNLKISAIEHAFDGILTNGCGDIAVRKQMQEYPHDVTNAHLVSFDSSGDPCPESERGKTCGGSFKC